MEGLMQRAGAGETTKPQGPEAAGLARWAPATRRTAPARAQGRAHAQETHGRQELNPQADSDTSPLIALLPPGLSKRVTGRDTRSVL